MTIKLKKKGVYSSFLLLTVFFSFSIISCKSITQISAFKFVADKERFRVNILLHNYLGYTDSTRTQNQARIKDYIEGLKYNFSEDGIGAKIWSSDDYSSIYGELDVNGVANFNNALFHLPSWQYSISKTSDTISFIMFVQPIDFQYGANIDIECSSEGYIYSPTNDTLDLSVTSLSDNTVRYTVVSKSDKINRIDLKYPIRKKQQSFFSNPFSYLRTWKEICLFVFATLTAILTVLQIYQIRSRPKPQKK